MARSKAPLILAALFFFALAGFMLLSAPSDDAMAELEGEAKSANQHPCPYADILGLDENSVNPHGEGGSLPPLAGMHSATPPEYVTDASDTATATAAPTATTDSVPLVDTATGAAAPTTTAAAEMPQSDSAKDDAARPAQTREEL